MKFGGVTKSRGRNKNRSNDKENDENMGRTKQYEENEVNSDGLHFGYSRRKTETKLKIE